MVVMAVYFEEGILLDSTKLLPVVRDMYHNDLFEIVEDVASSTHEFWDASIVWERETVIDGQQVIMTVFCTGPGARVYNWVSEGVEGHWIQAKPGRATHSGKREPALQMYRYKPYTNPKGGWKGPGVYYGAPFYRRGVWWPGIKPRDLYQQILDQTKGDFELISLDAVRAARELM